MEKCITSGCGFPLSFHTFSTGKTRVYQQFSEHAIQWLPIGSIGFSTNPPEQYNHQGKNKKYYICI
jgi:hypothetical protein